MPKYKITSPDGRTFEITAPKGAKQADLIAYAQKNTPTSPPKETGIFEKIKGIAQPAATIGTGMIGETVGGLAALATAPFQGVDKAVERLNAIRKQFTYVPPSEAGKENLQTIAKTLEPVSKAITAVEEKAGDVAYGATESPAAGAIGKTAPAAILSTIGLGPIKRASKIGQKLKAKKLLKQASPEIGVLRKEASKIYKEIDDSGAVLKGTHTEDLANTIKTTMEKEGFHPNLHPKIKTAIEVFDEVKGTNQPIGKIDTLRKIANSAVTSLDKSERRLGGKITRIIDDTLDDVTESSFVTKTGTPVGKSFKDARQLVRRSKKSELIKEAYTKAELQASGFENGLRTQFRSILSNEKKRRNFLPEEITAMEKVVKGGPAENLSKFFGKFAFGEGAASNVVGGGIGAGIGYSIAGPAGAVVVPAIGSVSRKLAQKLTRENAKFADAVVRAGKSGTELVKTYMENVPKKSRSVPELSELLLRPEVNLENLRKMMRVLPKEQKNLLGKTLIKLELIQASKE